MLLQIKEGKLIGKPLNYVSRTFHGFALKVGKTFITMDAKGEV